MADAWGTGGSALDSRCATGDRAEAKAASATRAEQGRFRKELEGLAASKGDDDDDFDDGVGGPDAAPRAEQGPDPDGMGMRTGLVFVCY